MTRRRIILDCETSSLTPSYEDGRGTIWELAIIELDAEHGPTERLWRMKPDPDAADPDALAVGQFAERTAGMHALPPGLRIADDLLEPWDEDGPYWSYPPALAAYLALSGCLDDVTLIGAVPSFDTRFLSAFFRFHGYTKDRWHYRLRDIGSMAWAWLQAHHLPHHLDTPALDAGTDDFARALGVDPDSFERHSALGDCRLAAAMLKVIEGGAP